MSDTWFDLATCDICNADTVPFYGREASKVLVLGYEPDKKDLNMGIPFSDSGGSVLKSELNYLGVRFDDLRYGNLWQHSPNDDCMSSSMNAMYKELVGKEICLLVGAEVTEYFIDKKIGDTNGLFLTSDKFSGLCVPCIDPKFVFTPVGTVGDIRLTLKKFVDYCKRMELL